MSFVTAKSYLAKPGEVPRRWHVVDASGLVLGRLASRVATVLMGKHKARYTPHVDTGDFVVVTNAAKVKITGRKLDQVEHDYYTYYAGGRKVIPLKKMMETHPDRVIKLAVRRMLPKSAMGRRMLTKLKVYNGTEHPHQAQCPQPMTLTSK
ncbi:MAG: 50S ribosomal protein L13 [Phycisphaerae bacterium]|nr:50S ribosomal protein L13 [Phycisphaerae bacterium]